MAGTRSHPLVLVALTEDALRLQVLEGLPNQGWRVLTTGTAGEVSALLLQHQPDALFIDEAMTANESIVNIVTALRIPCAALVASAYPETAVRLLRDCWMSVCLCPPIHLELLGESLRALLRLARTNPDQEPVIKPREGDQPGIWRLHPKTWLLTPPEGAPTSLSQAETTFLATLAATPGNPVSRKAVIAALGHSADYFDTRRLDTMLSRLRLKVRRECQSELPVRSIHSVGYAFAAPIALEG